MTELGDDRTRQIEVCPTCGLAECGTTRSRTRTVHRTTALSAGPAVMVQGRRHAFARQVAGRPGAVRLWSQGWYCEPCATAHFSAESGEPVRALGLQEFRARSWQAGGYGQLAEEHPAV